MQNRAPTWAAAIMACLLPLLVVLSFDDLEGTIGDGLGIDGGPALLAIIALLFLAVWASMIPVLSRAVDPARAGLLAGVYVTGVIFVILIASVEFVFIILLLLALFGGLALGAGALAGNVAAVVAGQAPTRALAFVVILLGGVMLAASLPFLPGPGFALLAPLLLVVLLLAIILFIGGGIWLWRRAQSG